MNIKSTGFLIRCFLLSFYLDILTDLLHSREEI